uniref:Uncharacterized protein n=1 Tax=Oryza barthii TaxID=65489 RepID=A0A0D3GV34_9ORYZ
MTPPLESLRLLTPPRSAAPPKSPLPPPVRPCPSLIATICSADAATLTRPFSCEYSHAPPRPSPIAAVPNPPMLPLPSSVSNSPDAADQLMLHRRCPTPSPHSTAGPAPSLPRLASPNLLPDAPSIPHTAPPASPRSKPPVHPRHRPHSTPRSTRPSPHPLPSVALQSAECTQPRIHASPPSLMFARHHRCRATALNPPASAGDRDFYDCTSLQAATIKSRKPAPESPPLKA